MQKALKEELRLWKQGNTLACNTILARLGANYINNYEEETSAYRLWNSLIRDCKPQEAGTLNEYYQRLGAITLASCKDTADYAGQFKEIVTKINNIYHVI